MKKPSNMAKRIKVIITMGPQGSGKGTQSKLLAEKFGLKYLGSGDILRTRQKKGGFTGDKLVKVMNKGELIPSFTLVATLGEELEKIKKNSKLKGLVVDGWTRTLPEAEMMDEALGWYEWDKDVKVLIIDISRKESLHRLTKRRQCKKCGKLIPWLGDFKKLKKCDQCGGELVARLDDTLSSIRMRLSEYKKETIPAINYYKKQGRLIKINGEQSIEDVFKDILNALNK